MAKGLKMNKKYIIIILLVLLNIVIRILFVPHEMGIDSFRTHYLANSIKEVGFAKWVLNPLSLIGFYPYSYPSGISFVLASISSLTQTSLELVILIFSILIGVIGLIGMYLFLKEYSNNDLISWIGGFIFSVSPLFLNFTWWTISTRGSFVVVVPFIFWGVLKYERTKNFKLILLTILLIIFSSFIHRMFLLALFLIPISYFGAKIILKRFNENRFFKIYIIACLLFVILLVLPFFLNIEPYETWKFTYKDGYFFDAGTNQDYDLGTLDDKIIFLNMVIDYLSNLGIIFLFVPIGFFLLSKKIKDKIKFKDLFIIFPFFLSAPLFLNGYYVSMFFLPLFCLLATMGFKYFISLFQNKILIKNMVFILVILTLIFSLFMNFHWINNFENYNEKAWIEDSTISSANFINKYNEEKKSILISNPLLNDRLKSYTNLPLLPANSHEYIGLLIYDIYTKEDIEIDFSLKYLITPVKSFIKLKSTKRNFYRDWADFVIKPLYSVKSMEIKNFYNVGYVLEKKKALYLRDHWKFYKDLEKTQPKIYDNNNIEIWYL